jgi:hypothetical protein
VPEPMQPRPAAAPTTKTAAYSLQEFHERVMSDGTAPWKVHRELLLPDDHGAVLE